MFACMEIIPCQSDECNDNNCLSLNSLIVIEKMYRSYFFRYIYIHTVMKTVLQTMCFIFFNFDNISYLSLLLSHIYQCAQSFQKANTKFLIIQLLYIFYNNLQNELYCEKCELGKAKSSFILYIFNNKGFAVKKHLDNRQIISNGKNNLAINFVPRQMDLCERFNQIKMMKLNGNRTRERVQIER